MSGAWVITGAASGFGRVFAERLAARGEALALWDRNAEGLEETRARLSGGTASVHVVDVTDREAVRAAVEASRRELGALGHLVSSAGVLRVGAAEEVPEPAYRQMIEVNYLGSVNVALELLPDVRRAAERGDGSLTFVASVAGLRGFPELAGYSASKFAVVGFGQALADELDGSGVRVKVLCPPAGDTPMVRDLPSLPPIYKLSPLMSAEAIVEASLRELERPGLFGLVDLRSKALWRAGRLWPGLVDRIVRSVR